MKLTKFASLVLPIFVAFIGLSAFAQNRTTITGVVSDQNGDPLPGASVVIKGTTTGSTASIDGTYSIYAEKGDVLVFSFVGMNSLEVKVMEAAVINATLHEDSEFLEESVAIGYGKQTRTLLTNALTQVEAKEFEHSPQQNPLAQLQGKVPGLSVQVTSGQPGTTSEIFIRGGTTTSTESDTPLIIVDGLVSQGFRSIQDINPSDIESMTVLKDAASTAIYGAKAANGIILVTTKSGQTGKAKVNFKYTLGVDTQKKLDLLNAREYVYLTRSAINTDPRASESVRNSFLTGSFGMSTGNDYNAANTLEFLDVFIEKYGGDFVADLINNQGWQTMEDPVTGRQLIFMDTDFQKATYQTAFKHEYDLNVQGGTEKFTYYASLRHLNQQGTVRGTWYKNYSMAFNGSYQASRKLKIFSKATLNVGNRNQMSNAVNSLQRAMFMPPTYRLYYEDGTPAPGEGMSSFRPREYENYYKTQYNKNIQYRVGFQAGADWEIIDGLKFSPIVYYSFTQGITSTFEALNETTGTEIRPATAASQFDGHLQTDFLLSYDKTINKHHHIDAMAGATYTKDNEFALSGSGSGSSTDLIPTLNATADSTQRVTSTMTEEAMLSFFGRIGYDYKEKYIVSASIRADGSSRFAPNHRWGIFPGASVGWNMHKENFFAPAKRAVSKLKIRGSWGLAGNNSLSISDTYGEYGITSTTYLGEVGILNTVLGNADLLWETTESFDVGVDLGFLNNRIELSADIYDKITYNRLFETSLPTTTGYSSIMYNYGSIGTKGIELELNAVPISTKNFTWNLNFNFTFYRSTVRSLPDNGEEKNRIGGNYIYDPATGQNVKVGGTAEGERFGVRYAFHAIGIYQTDEEAALAPYDEQAKGRTKYAGDTIYEDRNGDGYINALDMVFVGYIRPDKLGGMTNELRWKNLSLRIVVDYALGHVINNGTLGYALGSIRNNFNTFKVALTDCWTPSNTSARYPRFTPMSDSDYSFRNFTRTGESIGSNTSGQTNTTMFYQKGDYLAFREISISYELPENLCRKIRLSALQFFGGVYNLGYITAYDGLNPEKYLGYDYGFYPRSREYSVGVSITF